MLAGTEHADKQTLDAAKDSIDFRGASIVGSRGVQALNPVCRWHLSAFCHNAEITF